jgi:hypothetical protein
MYLHRLDTTRSLQEALHDLRTSRQIADQRRETKRVIEIDRQISYILDEIQYRHATRWV